MRMGESYMSGIIRFETPAELEQYKLDVKQSIVTLFQQLARKGSPVYLQAADGQWGESRLLNVDVANNTMLLAYTQDVPLNRKLLEDKAMFFAEHFSAQVQFFIPKLARVMFKQGHVFTLSLPAKVYRIQRRESYRAEVPMENQVSCTVPITGNGHIQFPIADISRGGIALLDRMNRLSVEKGSLLTNCQVQLPKLGALQANMQVCNRAQVQMPGSNTMAVRIGCKFVSINSGMENLLQRYIDQLEFQIRSSM